MTRKSPPSLSRREREIMDVIYRLGEASAQDVRQNLAKPPSYSTVRALLRVLEDKGHVTHRSDGPRYLYLPTVPREQARESALLQLVATFFDDSPPDAVAALLGLSANDLSDRDLDQLQSLIDRAREEGR